MPQNVFTHRDLNPCGIRNLTRSWMSTYIVIIEGVPSEQKWLIVLTDTEISERTDKNNRPTTVTGGTATFMDPELQGYLDEVRASM